MAYIKRADALEVCSEHSEWFNAEKDYCCSSTADSIYQDICNLPTADVVEVVRCKDCKHYKPYAKPVEDFDGKCIVRGCATDENEFCSYGERRDT